MRICYVYGLVSQGRQHSTFERDQINRAFAAKEDLFFRSFIIRFLFFLPNLRLPSPTSTRLPFVAFFYHSFLALHARLTRSASKVNS
jgi:hypothetical protein